MTETIHGTYAGWNKHMRARTPVCAACAAAHAAYKREWRARTGRTRARLLPYSAAEITALRSGRYARSRA